MTRKIRLPLLTWLCVQIVMSLLSSTFLFVVAYFLIQSGMDMSFFIVIGVIFATQAMFIVLFNALFCNVPLALSEEGIRKRNKVFRWEDAVSVLPKKAGIFKTLSIKYSDGRSIVLEARKTYLKSIEDACNNRQFLTMFWAASLQLEKNS